MKFAKLLSILLILVLAFGVAERGAPQDDGEEEAEDGKVLH